MKRNRQFVKHFKVLFNIKLIEIGERVLPTELRPEAENLKKEIDLEDDSTAVPTVYSYIITFQSLSIDDEYSRAALEDPKVCILTSHNPSQRLKQFAKEIKIIIPNSQIVNRGSYQLSELVDSCRKNGFTDMVFLRETLGDPSALIVSHLPYGPTCFFTICNTVMRHDIEGATNASEAYPHLLFHNLNSKLGERITTILKHLFPVPKTESKRVITFASNMDYISFRHHVYQKVTHKDVELTEVGPRFEMKPYQIRLGSIEMKEAENEWVYRPYMNSSKKRRILEQIYFSILVCFCFS